MAYELDLHKKLENKTLAIIEPRDEYKKDKIWSFWKVINHNFDDCVKKNWNYIFGKKNEVRTEASFVSRDYEEPVHKSEADRKSDKSSS